MEELRRFLGWLLPHHAELGGVTEIRILRRGERSGVWSTMVGPDDLEALVDALTPRRHGRARNAITPAEPPSALSLGEMARLPTPALCCAAS